MCLVSFLSHLYEDQQAKDDIAIKGTRQEQLIILYVVYNTMIMWMKLLYIVVIKANETKTTLAISIADCLVWWHVSFWLHWYGWWQGVDNWWCSNNHNYEGRSIQTIVLLVMFTTLNSNEQCFLCLVSHRNS